MYYQTTPSPLVPYLYLIICQQPLYLNVGPYLYVTETPFMQKNLFVFSETVMSYKELEIKSEQAQV
jgi:hypothetical protein